MSRLGQSGCGRSARVNLCIDLKAERLKDGSVRIYVPEGKGESRVFTSGCSGPDCCDGCFQVVACEAFDFAVSLELAKVGLKDADVMCVMRLNGMPFNPFEVC